MNIYIYSDESGVFDKKHNEYFVFGGLIIIGKNNKDIWTRKYSAKERQIKNNNPEYKNIELKAAKIDKKYKYELYRLFNNCYKFGVIIYQRQLMDRIFQDKKIKQRYLDYVFRVGIKNALEKIIKQEQLNINSVREICFYLDEHSTATNEGYELTQELEEDLVIGNFDENFKNFYPPLFNKYTEIKVNFYDSKGQYLIRAADVIANKIYNDVLENNIIASNEKLFIKQFP